MRFLPQAPLVALLSAAVVVVPARGLFPAGTTVIATSTGVVVPVRKVTPIGAQVLTPCGGVATVLSGTPLGRPAVVLDPGHGGDEEGALGPNGLKEKDLNLAVSRYAQRALEAEGYPTVLTRTAEYRVTLQTRGEILAALRPAAFVSVHHNAVPDGPLSRPGTEMYYQVRSTESRRLGGILHEEVVAALSPLGLAWVGDRDAGVKTRLSSRGDDYYGIVRRSATAKVPGVLAELAFVTNPAEAEALARPEVQRAEGEAIARGVIRFLTTKDRGSGYVTAYPRTEPAGPGGGSQGCIDPPL